MKKHYITSICLLGLLSACLNTTPEFESPWENQNSFAVEYDLRNLVTVDFFAKEGESMGESTLIEASGLARSRKNEGYLWTHQDRGNDNRIFLMDENTGETVAAYKITGMRNRDWEDIEIVTDPQDGMDYLYLGDIGDNAQVYNSYTIYKFLEPEFEPAHRGKVVDLEWEFEEFKFRFPDKSHDTEALMVDPWTGDIFLATKRDFWSMLFVAPYPQPVEEEFTLIHAGNFGFRRALAGTVSDDGLEVLIKNDDQIFYWNRTEGESFLNMMQEVPKEAPYNPVEAQGEAICFGKYGGYYTLSEYSNGITPELFHYKRIK
ncbi:hypothetical protein [Pleomorphovibrio marinus]|uniref:hypothetical protein n=1 Tax=Pleomorphovibrio marinus TaxID=2164132 RepID=UPI0013005BB4|nr:hypothetical protein [Pleomorphovibrio marinus]